MAEPTAPVVTDEPTPCRFALQHPDWHVCVRSTGAPLPAGETCHYEAAAQLVAEAGPICVLCGQAGADETWRGETKVHWGCGVDHAYDAQRDLVDAADGYEAFDAEAASAAAEMSHVAERMGA